MELKFTADQLAAREQLGLQTVANKTFGGGGVQGVDLGMEDASERAIERLTSLLSGVVHALVEVAHGA